MFSRLVSRLRYTLGIFALGLALAGVLVFGQEPPANPPATDPAPNPPAVANPAAASTTPANPANAPVSSAVDLPLPKIDKMEPEQVPRGGAVTFIGENFPAKEEDIVVFLNGKPAGEARLVSADRKSFIFAVPTSLSLGKYNVRVDIKLKDPAVPFSPKMPAEAMLTVYGEAGKTTPKIVAVSPILGYPEKKIYGFTVVGEGFSTKGSDNGLVIQNRGEIEVCWPDEKCKPEEIVFGRVINDRELEFKGIPQERQGLNGVQIRVGQDYSNAFEITLSRVERTTPILISLGIFAALAGLIYFIVRRGLVVKEIAGRKYSVLQSLLLDKETDTYSLSRFQFYVWTAAALLGYLYLMVSRSLVQWKPEFVDVPSGLPGIILISASTAILAQGITNSKGPKGSGEVHPTVADLVTSGGLAVPERFQFFLWTVLGALVFIFLVLASDPGTIKDLPTIPTGFLEIMGVSSLGYLGGKMARKPGPVIDDILATPSSLKIKILGRNLSKDASFRIGNDDILVSKINNGEKPRIVEGDAETNMAKILEFTIADPIPDEWVDGEPKLTIINPDGQTASWGYKRISAEEAAATAAAKEAVTAEAAFVKAAKEAEAKEAAAAKAEADAEAAVAAGDPTASIKQDAATKAREDADKANQALREAAAEAAAAAATAKEAAETAAAKAKEAAEATGDES